MVVVFIAVQIVSFEYVQSRMRIFRIVPFDPRVLFVAEHTEDSVLASEEKDVAGAGCACCSLYHVLGVHVCSDKLDEFQVAKVDDFARLVNAEVHNNELVVGWLVVLVDQ